MSIRPGDLVVINHMNNDPLMLAWREIYGVGIVLEVLATYVRVYFFSNIGNTCVAPYKLEVISDGL